MWIAFSRFIFIGMLLLALSLNVSATSVHYSVMNDTEDGIDVDCMAFFLHYVDHLHLGQHENRSFDFISHFYTDPTGHTSICTIHTKEAEDRGCSYKISFYIKKIQDHPAKVAIKWEPHHHFAVNGDVTEIDIHEISNGLLCHHGDPVKRVDN